jgi:hypothetical protein
LVHFKGREKAHVNLHIQMPNQDFAERRPSSEKFDIVLPLSNHPQKPSLEGEYVNLITLVQS